MDMVKLAYELRLLLYRIYNGMFYLSEVIELIMALG